MVVTKVSRSGQEASQDLPGNSSRNSRAAIPEGTVTIRIRIGSEGMLEGAAIEESSGSDALDRRALQAAKAAAPFSPPPAKLLTLEGFTELAFAVEFAR
ncbi:energy transducer TonB [Methylobacterium sp. C25]|nr:energy transducer TonB [Methylobacterium sp. C25]